MASDSVRLANGLSKPLKTASHATRLRSRQGELLRWNQLFRFKIKRHWWIKRCRFFPDYLAVENRQSIASYTTSTFKCYVRLRVIHLRKPIKPCLTLLQCANARAARKELQTYPKLSGTVWWRLHTLANQNPNGLFRRLAGKVPRTMTFENGGTCQM